MKTHFKMDVISINFVSRLVKKNTMKIGDMNVKRNNSNGSRRAAEQEDLKSWCTWKRKFAQLSHINKKLIVI